MRWINPKTRQRHRRVLWRTVCIFYWILAFIGTHIPADKLVTPNRVGDQTLHFLGYFLLSVLFAQTLFTYGLRTVWRWSIVLGVLAIYGALDELTQPFFNRYASSWDYFANICGTISGLLAWESGRFLVLILKVRREK